MNDDKYKNNTDRNFERLNYETRAAYWYTNKWLWASVGSIVAIIVALWAAGVLWAGPKGAGDAYKTNQSGTNRISKQEWFEQTYQDIQNADKTVGLMHDALAGDPSYVNKTNYTGARAACNQIVANYDAEARKYTSQDWRDNKLPSAIDQTDPKFDCKEETK